MDLSSWLWIALFIAFGLGWLFARYDIKSVLKNNNKLPIQYFKGLQYILNEQPDKAIDAFIQVAQLDPETADLHLALGQMFRKKGEFNRSIRIHESLANRGLSTEYQEKAYIALGEDYYRAGMFDRAEKVFTKFLEHHIYKDVAIKHLLIIAKLEQDWQKAVNLTEFLEQSQKEHQRLHLQLQYADSLIQAQKTQDAQNELNKIDAKYNTHARFMLTQANLILLENNSNKTKAIEQVQKTIYQNNNINYELIFPILRKIYANNLDDIISFFHNLEEKGIKISHIQAIYEFKFNILNNAIKDKIQKNEDIAYILSEMQKLLEMELKNCLSMAGVKRYTDLLLQIINNPNANNSYAQYINKDFIASVNHVVSTDSPIKYVCSECGFRAKNFSWACHGCGEWESISVL
ncbi:MAG: hypothetical protein RLZZ210_727 [Pseudomonadota bacterium]|jgi:lipopolysaccharide biosynthesis regulator YciM